MRKLGWLLLAGIALAEEPSYQPVGNMSQLMINIIYPTSDALFYIARTPPRNDVDWGVIQNQALMLAESGNLLMMPGRVRDQGDWIKDSKLLVDVGMAAYKFALAKNMDGILGLNDQLTAACVTCHMQYRPRYRRRQ